MSKFYKIMEKLIDTDRMNLDDFASSQLDETTTASNSLRPVPGGDFGTQPAFAFKGTYGLPQKRHKNKVAASTKSEQRDETSTPKSKAGRKTLPITAFLRCFQTETEGKPQKKDTLILCVMRMLKKLLRQMPSGEECCTKITKEYYSKEMQELLKDSKAEESSYWNTICELHRDNQELYDGLPEIPPSCSRKFRRSFYQSPKVKEIHRAFIELCFVEVSLKHFNLIFDEHVTPQAKNETLEGVKEYLLNGMLEEERVSAPGVQEQRYIQVTELPEVSQNPMPTDPRLGPDTYEHNVGSSGHSMYPQTPDIGDLDDTWKLQLQEFSPTWEEDWQDWDGGRESSKLQVMGISFLPSQEMDDSDEDIVMSENPEYRDAPEGCREFSELHVMGISSPPLQEMDDGAEDFMMSEDSDYFMAFNQ